MNNYQMNVEEREQRFRDYSEMCREDLIREFILGIHLEDYDDDDEINQVIRHYSELSKGEMIYRLIHLEDDDEEEEEEEWNSDEWDSGFDSEEEEEEEGLIFI